MRLYDWKEDARRFEDIDRAHSTHPCPRCGQLTAGAWSEGGLRWAICEDCMGADHRTAPGGQEGA